jgi:hypothetical protein
MGTPGGADPGKDATFFSHFYLVVVRLAPLGFLQHFFHQPDDFTRFGVPAGLEFGVYQFIVDGDLVPPAVGWDQGDRFNFRLEALEQVTGQAHGPVGVVSDRTVSNGDL